MNCSANTHHFDRLESSFRSFSRPVLHSAARVVQEMGKSRAAAFALGLQDIDEGAYVKPVPENNDSYDQDYNETSHPEGNENELAFLAITHSLSLLMLMDGSICDTKCL